MSNELVPVGSGKELYRVSTDAAGLCKDIVVNTARNIQGRRYVQCEGWQAIAIAHGCVASADEVERIEDGFRAIGKVIRMDTGMVIARSEGFVGKDEPTWFGGKSANGKNLPKRPDYAIRAMAQTRAISRACRAAFAHVVVMMNAGLSTTPAEEVPDEGFNDQRQPPMHAVNDAASQAPNPPRQNGETKARAWVAQNKGALNTFVEPDQYRLWENTSAAALNKLQAEYPDAYADLAGSMSAARDRLGIVEEAA